MRILIITDFYWPYVGGVEQHVRSLAATLVDLGHHVRIATLAAADAPATEADGGVTVHRLRSTTQRFAGLFSSAARPWAPPVPDPAITLQLRRLIATHRPDVVHGHDWLARSFLPLRRWSERRFGTRFVSSLHYYTLSCARKNLMQAMPAARAAAEVPCSGPGVGKCLACATRHYGIAVGPFTAVANLAGARLERGGAAAVIAVSAAVATGNGLRPDAPAVHVVPNFLPPPDAVPGATAAAADDDASGGASAASAATFIARLPDGEFILFVGDLLAIKGVDVLLAAYARTGTSVPLLLIGESWPATPSDLPAGVVVGGRWPNAAILEAWRRCTIAVVPSIWAEPFGIVVIEAMAGGAAVVASRAGGIPEIVEDGVSAILVEPGDADALADALAALLADPTRRSELGAAARRRAAHYTASNVVPDVVEVYRRATSARPRSASTSS